jgi:hypothetical protein
MTRQILTEMELFVLKINTIYCNIIFANHIESANMLIQFEW